MTEAPGSRQVDEREKRYKDNFNAFVREKVVPGNPKKKSVIARLKKIYEKDQKEISKITGEKLAALKGEVSKAGTMSVIMEEDKQARQNVNDMYKSSINLAGGAKIDNNEEIVNFALYYLPALESMDVQYMYNTIKTWAVEAAEGKTMEILKKLAQGKSLADSDYGEIANRLINSRGKGVRTVEINKGDPERMLIEAGQTGLMTVAASLDINQRIKLGEKMVTMSGGLDVIDRLGWAGYYSPAALKKLYDKAKSLGKDVSKYIKQITDGTYEKAQKQIREYREKIEKNVDKFPHGSFANEVLTYRNVLLYEIGIRAAVAMIAINGFIHIKNKDFLGMFSNLPMLGGLAFTAVGYDVVTEGHGRQMLAQATGKKDRLQKEQEKKQQEFADKVLAKPELGRWFKDNIDSVETGFAAVNPEKKEQKTHIKFADMQIDPPQEMDGIRDPKIMEKHISDWYYELHFGLNGGKTDSGRDRILAEIWNPIDKPSQATA